MEIHKRIMILKLYLRIPTVAADCISNVSNLLKWQDNDKTIGANKQRLYFIKPCVYNVLGLNYIVIIRYI